MRDQDLMTVFKKSQNASLAFYDDNARYGEKIDRDKIRANLVVRLRMQFEIFESRNQARAVSNQI